ncbi:TPA: hypothetical protein DIC40_05715 [Patescibacteria group bacterium]|nr:hypothetical protein [Candidatus Gracilibacteria bacterium]
MSSGNVISPIGFSLSLVITVDTCIIPSLSLNQNHFFPINTSLSFLFSCKNPNSNNFFLKCSFGSAISSIEFSVRISSFIIFSVFSEEMLSINSFHNLFILALVDGPRYH